MDEMNEQVGQLLPTFQKKFAQISPTPLSGEAVKWVKKTFQNLHRLHKPVVEAREDPRPSLIAVELYSNHTELKEEGSLPLNTEGSNDSNDETLPSQ
jgi:hypothetical protein